MASTQQVALGKTQTDEAGARRLMRYRWVVFAAVSLSSMLMYFHFAWGATLSGYHTVDWGLDAGELGLLAALGFFPYAVAQIPVGYLTDLLGGRKLLCGAAALLSVGTALFAGAPTFALAGASRVLISLAISVSFAASYKVLMRWFQAREFASITGGYILLGTAGSILGTLPLALAAERWGWRAPMVVVAGVTALIAIVLWALVRNAPAELGLPALADVDPAEAPLATPEHNPRPSFREGLKLWQGVPALKTIALLLFATTGALWSFQSLWAGPLLRQVRGLPVAGVGLALLMFTLGKGVGPPLFGLISDRLVLARKPVVVFGLAAQTALWALLILDFDGLPLGWLYGIFLGLSALHGGVLVSQTMVKEMVPPHLFGISYGLINGSGFYGAAALQLITGSVLNAIGPSALREEPIYSAQAYGLALSPILLVMLVALILSFKLKETLATERRELWPRQTS
jgi:sugar phosphate permease